MLEVRYGSKYRRNFEQRTARVKNYYSERKSQFDAYKLEMQQRRLVASR